MPAHTLVIVESPTKAKTISSYLGKDYKVLSSFGHVRDLPKNGLGIDTENGYTPTYEISTRAQEHVALLQDAAKEVQHIVLATDEDREGEAIAWHLATLLKIPYAQANRIVFHEITKKAILTALENPRTLDINLVNAQQTRRIIDRLVGYELSPFLWKKVGRGLSAGRVQSAAVRLIVEKEREINAFIVTHYWSVHGIFRIHNASVEAELKEWKGRTIEKFFFSDKKTAENTIISLQKLTYTVGEKDSKRVERQPYPPFTTSQFQQAASSRLHMAPKQAMTLAQKLYELGWITYMRTDSVNLSEQFISQSQEWIKSNLGDSYLTGGKRYSNKNKNAQEAHEAIRPTDPSHTPETAFQEFDEAMARVYRLIWERAISSQLPALVVEQTGLQIIGGAQEAVFRATGSVVIFDGWTKILADPRENKILPIASLHDVAIAESITSTYHETEPPPRYNEATLIKALEELGIGRPSTYAPTVSTIVERGYIEKKQDKRLHPNPVAFVVTDLLVSHFPHIIDYGFTAKLENEFDEIAEGTREWVSTIDSFYKPFKKTLLDKINSVSTSRILGKDPSTNLSVIAKSGRFGPYIQLGTAEEKNEIVLLQSPLQKRITKSGKTKKIKGEKPIIVSLPPHLKIDEITLADALSLLSKPPQAESGRIVGTDPETGLTIYAKEGRFGPYVQLGTKEEAISRGDAKPKMASIPKGSTVETVSLETACKALSLPRTVGIYEGKPVIATIGRYGPYIKLGDEMRSIPRQKNYDPFTISLENAIELLSEPKKGKRNFSKKTNNTSK